MSSHVMIHTFFRDDPCYDNMFFGLYCKTNISGLKSHECLDCWYKKYQSSWNCRAIVYFKDFVRFSYNINEKKYDVVNSRTGKIDAFIKKVDTIGENYTVILNCNASKTDDDKQYVYKLTLSNIFHFIDNAMRYYSHRRNIKGIFNEENMKGCGKGCGKNSKGKSNKNHYTLPRNYNHDTSTSYIHISSINNVKDIELYKNKLIQELEFIISTIKKSK